MTTTHHLTQDGNYKFRLKASQQQTQEVLPGNISLCLMEDICDKFFKGVLTKLPVYNINTVAGGVIKYIGKMFVHSILHGGPGITIFCEAKFSA